MVTSTPTPARSPRARIVSSRTEATVQQQSFKIDSEGSSEDKLSQSVQIQQQIQQQQQIIQQQQSVKRVAPRQTIVAAAAPKRIKIQPIPPAPVQEQQPDPLDASELESLNPQEIKTSDTAEFEMPMESSQLTAKPEPEYEDMQETDNNDQDDEGNYVEDDTYGGGDTTKYEESYFTEGDDTKAGVSGFMDSYSREDQTDAQG